VSAGSWLAFKKVRASFLHGHVYDREEAVGGREVTGDNQFGV